MPVFPYYNVIYYHGRIVEDGIKSEEKVFENEDLLLARSEALNYAWEIEKSMKDKWDAPSLVEDTPALIPMLDTFSLDVWFVENEDYDWMVYGSETHTVLTGLFAEAKHYLKNSLIQKKDLIQILQNYAELQKDLINPPFLMASETKEIPDFEFYTIEVLPFDLEKILIAHKEI